MKVWKSNIHNAEEALDLPVGELVCNLGGLRFAETPKPDDVLLAATAIKLSEDTVIAATQAKIMIEAQSRNIALTDWAATLE